MPRIRSIPRERAALIVRNLYDASARQPEGVPPEHPWMAHRPELLLTFSNFYRELWTGGVLDPRTKALVALRAAALLDDGFTLARLVPAASQAGLSDSQASALQYRNWAEEKLFDERDSALLSLTEKLVEAPVAITDGDIDSLRKWFADSHLVELALLVGSLLLANRFHSCFGLEEE